MELYAVHHHSVYGLSVSCVMDLPCSNVLFPMQRGIQGLQGAIPEGLKADVLPHVIHFVDQLMQRDLKLPVLKALQVPFHSHSCSINCAISKLFLGVWCAPARAK